MDECNETMKPSMDNIEPSVYNPTIKDICNDYIHQAYNLGYEAGFKAHQQESYWKKFNEERDVIDKKLRALLDQDK